MDVYVINMPHRADRRRAMESLVGRLGIDADHVHFVEPVKVAHVPDEYAKHGMTSGYMSLNLTVRDKVFDMAAHGSDSFLVFEDDAIERVQASEIMPRVYEMLHGLQGIPWDVVYLEYCMEHCSAAASEQRVGPWLQRASSPYCTAATLYNRTSIDRIRRCLDVRKKLIDFSYVECIKDDELVAYIAMPALFAQDAIYGAGDLAHLSPTKVQWWLNLVLRMYPDGDLKHGPRLPACLGRELFGYVRWGNVAFMVAALVVLGLLLLRKKHRKK